MLASSSCDRARGDHVDVDRLVGGTVDLRRQILDVLALVAVLRRILPECAGPDRFTEAVDLRARVVEVVLAEDRVAVMLEDAGQRVAVGGVAAAGGDEHRRRVRGDELEQNPLGVRCTTRSELLAGVEHGPQGIAVPIVGHTRFRKPGPATS